MSRTRRRSVPPLPTDRSQPGTQGTGSAGRFDTELLLQLAAARRPSAARALWRRARAQGTVRPVLSSRRLLSHPFPGVPAGSGAGWPPLGGGEAVLGHHRPGAGRDLGSESTFVRQRSDNLRNPRCERCAEIAQGRLSTTRPLLPLPVAF